MDPRRIRFWASVMVVGTILVLAMLLLATLAYTADVPEFPFKNTAQTSGVPGWTQTAVGGGTCGDVQVFLLQFTNPEGQMIQIFSDAERKIVGAWYPEAPYQVPTHLWLGTINPENGKITMRPPIPYDPVTYPSPCVYWRPEA